MVDYNDGNWHAWHGESMKPAGVHEKSVIEYIWHYEKTEMFGCDERVAGWDDQDESPSWENILKFRVIKEHKEPREFWVAVRKGDAIDISRDKGILDCYGYEEIIHVREVLE